MRPLGRPAALTLSLGKFKRAACSLQAQSGARALEQSLAHKANWCLSAQPLQPDCANPGPAASSRSPVYPPGLGRVTCKSGTMMTHPCRATVRISEPVHVRGKSSAWHPAAFRSIAALVEYADDK